MGCIASQNALGETAESGKKSDKQPAKQTNPIKPAETAAPGASAEPELMVLGLTRPITEMYELGDQIGQPGQFGCAVLATHKVDKTEWAVKIIGKAKFSSLVDKKAHFSTIRDEIRIMIAMDHPNIIKFTNVYEDKTNFYIVMECCRGGELFDRIKSQPSGQYTEKGAAKILRQICEGIRYMHEHKIAHCDLKPDNFLFLDDSDDNVKIIDFGMSKHCQRRKYMTSFRGTPYYVAPEVLQGKYAEHCDMWSFGVVMFILIFGFPPFFGDADMVILEGIAKGFTPEVKKGYGPWFPDSIDVSDMVKDLIAKCLTTDHAKRISAAEALEHPWLKGEAPEAPLEIIKQLQEFSGKSKLKAACVGLFEVFTDDELKELQETFDKIDTNKDGSICSAELQAALADCGAGGAHNVEQLVAMADMDGDGKISYRELMAAATTRKFRAKEERLWEAFNKLDLDGDGSVTAEELERVLVGGEFGDVKELLAEVDTDGDGKISYDEFIRMWVSQEDPDETTDA